MALVGLGTANWTGDPQMKLETAQIGPETAEMCLKLENMVVTVPTF